MNGTPAFAGELSRKVPVQYLQDPNPHPSRDLSRKKTASCNSQLGPISLKFHPHYLSEMANVNALRLALKDFARPDDAGELSVLQLWPDSPIQLSLIRRGRDPAHAEVESACFFSQMHEAEVRAQLEQLFRPALAT